MLRFNTCRTGFDVEDHLHGLFPEWNHRAQPSQVKIVLDEVLGDLAEVLMTRE